MHNIAWPKLKQKLDHCLILACPITWKQWLLHIEAMQLLHWRHTGRADPGMSPDSADVPGSALSLWHQYTNCTASVGSN